MAELIFRIFIKDYDKTEIPAVREKYGVLSGVVGIILNTVLSIFKMIFGALVHSVSIVADGVNNLFDAVSSVISILGFKISGKPADAKHPYGYGRIEYLSALALGSIIIMTGVELIKTSVDKLKNPEPVSFSLAAVIVLVVAILGKIWLAFFNKRVGEKINSLTVDAVVADSIGDIAATLCSLIALVASRFTSLPLDGVMGIVVALVVLYAGIGVFRDTLGPLLGEPPTQEVIKRVEECVMSKDGVVGIHDLVLHSYGAGSVFGSLHAEVPADVDIMISHDVIDNIEHELKMKFGYEISIHLDPVLCNDEKTNELKSIIKKEISEISPVVTIHDFRVVEGPTHTNLIFDAVLPFKFEMSDTEFTENINNRVKKYGNYFCVINIDKKYA